MFGRIDHIGVAVEDLDAAIALHERTYGMPLVHRETVTEQGVEAVLLDVGENHVELLAPLGRRHAGRQVPRQARARACTTSPTRCADIDAALARAARRPALRLIDETPRTGIRGSRVAFLHPAALGRRADRDRPARGGHTDGRRLQRSAIGFQGGQVLVAARRRRTSSTSCARRCGTAASGWHEVEADDGAVLRRPRRRSSTCASSRDEHRVGFGV